MIYLAIYKKGLVEAAPLSYVLGEQSQKLFEVRDGIFFHSLTVVY